MSVFVAQTPNAGKGKIVNREEIHMYGTDKVRDGDGEHDMLFCLVALFFRSVS